MSGVGCCTGCQDQNQNTPFTTASSGKAGGYVRYPQNGIPTTEGMTYTADDADISYKMDATPDFKLLKWAGTSPTCDTDTGSCKTDFGPGWNFAGMYDGAYMDSGVQEDSGCADCVSIGGRHTLCYWKAAGGQMNTCPGLSEFSDTSAPLANVPPQNTMGPLTGTKFRGKYLPVNENDAALTARNRAKTNALWVFNLPYRWQMWAGDGPSTENTTPVYYSSTYDLDYFGLIPSPPTLPTALKGVPPRLPSPATRGGTAGPLKGCVFYGDYVEADDKPETIARTDVLWVFSQINMLLTDSSMDMKCWQIRCPNTEQDITPLPNYYSKYYYGMFDPKSVPAYDSISTAMGDQFQTLRNGIINNVPGVTTLKPPLKVKPQFGVTVSWKEVPGTSKFTLGYTGDPVSKLRVPEFQYIAGFRGVISVADRDVTQINRPRDNGLPYWPKFTGFKSMNESFWAPTVPPPKNSTRWKLHGISNPYGAPFEDTGNNGFLPSEPDDLKENYRYLVSTTLSGSQPLETFTPPTPLFGIEVSWTPVDKWAKFTRAYLNPKSSDAVYPSELNPRSVISAANSALPNFMDNTFIEYPVDKKPAFWAPVVTADTFADVPEWMEEGIVYDNTEYPFYKNAAANELTKDYTLLIGTVMVNLRKFITVSDHQDNGGFTSDFSRGKVECTYPQNLIDTTAKLITLTSLITSGKIHPEMGDELAGSYCSQEVKTCSNSAYTPGVPMVACSRFRSIKEDGNACRAWALARSSPVKGQKTKVDTAYVNYCLKNSANQDCDCLSRQEVAGVDKKLRQSYVDVSAPIEPGTNLPLNDKCWYMPCKDPNAYSLVTKDIADAPCDNNICQQVIGGWAGRDVNLNNVDATMDCRSDYKKDYLDGKYTCTGNSCVAATSPKDAFPSLAECSAKCGNVRPPSPSPSGPGLSGGAIAGISAGCIVFIIIIIVIAVTTKKKIAAP